ncbi:MAG TPA: hypothetical protein VFI37_01285 [Gaiellaceae bacterium]|jgi:hypothetical protein|nr:hypothetical protein [Gaiellaceae bacterium]
MRTAAAAILGCFLLAAPAAAAPRELSGTWRGTWTNAAVGTHGAVRLVGGSAPALRLAGPALGCAQPTRLPLHYRRGVLTGNGRDVPCNEGLRWSLRGRLAHGRIAGTLTLRLADGSRATVALELRRAR